MTVRALWLIILFQALFLNVSTGQILNSQVIYKKSLYEKKDLTEIKDISIRKQLERIEEINNQLEYELIFNKTSSVFYQLDNLNIGEDSPLALIAKGFKQVFYFDISENQKIRYTESTGKGFNVIIPKEKYKWKITNESKKFGDYTCYKAVAQINEYNHIKKAVQEFSPTVWFTPEIPVPFGPIGLDGLPGLVLEASFNGQEYYYASKINLNSSDSKIEKPKGENISEENYAELIKEFSQRN